MPGRERRCRNQTDPVPDGTGLVACCATNPVARSLALRVLSITKNIDRAIQSFGVPYRSQR